MWIHHLALRTRRLSDLERFYEVALGLRRMRVHHRDDGTLGSVWLRAGDTILMLERAEPREHLRARRTMELLCFGVTSRAALTRARRRVERLARIEGETPHTFYFRDPDGRRVGVSYYPVRRSHGLA